MLVAANMDPAANPLPDKLDLERRPNRHIAFGTGIHFCLGHQLARLEGKCALEALYARWPKLRLAVEPRQIRWRSRPGIRRLSVCRWSQHELISRCHRSMSALRGKADIGACRQDVCS